ncbi:hypothetical protein V6N13_059378 [Hibiscus sabdariffa]|uniref:Uncharacterized protein n=1 Tax=Hibiscus sabdariffa TaxID=183260 RepID=A0ABR2GDJ9_9ROSI
MIELIPLCTLLESGNRSLVTLLAYFGSGDVGVDSFRTLLESSRCSLFILLAYFGSDDDVVDFFMHTS